MWSRRWLCGGRSASFVVQPPLSGINEAPEIEIVNMSRKIFVEQYFLIVVIILLWKNNCFNLLKQLRILMVKRYLSICLDFVIVKVSY